MGNNPIISNEEGIKGKEYNILQQSKVKNLEFMQNTNEANIQNIQIIDNPKWDILNSKFLQSNRYCPNDLQTISLRIYDQLQSRKSYLFKIQSILLDGQFDMNPNIQTHKKFVQNEKNKQNQKNHEKLNVKEKSKKKQKKILSTKKQIQNKKIYNNLEINVESFISLKKLNVQNYYKFIEKIGEGTYGNVYKVLCLRTNQFRAIKVLKKSKLYKKINQQKKDILKLTQIQALSKIDHPNILKLYQVYFYNQNYYLITQFCEGGSIFSYLKYHKSYSQNIVKRIMKQLLNALSYLHQMRIAHRDIKIQNIALVKQITNLTNQNQTEIKILDLGQALFLKLKHNNKDKKQIGTIAYMAPQVLDGYYSELSDIWSCGVLLYMLMTGVAPFCKPSKKQTFLDIKTKQINFQQSQTQHISKEVKTLIMKMLNRDPFKRITAKQALKSNWFSENIQNSSLQSQQMKAVVHKLKSYYQSNNFVSLVQHYLIFLKLSQQQRSQIGKIFKKIDKDSSGSIDVNELRQTFQQSFGQNYYDCQDFQQILLKIDKNNNKKIDLNQFITAFYNLKREFYQKQLFLAFDYFDIDGNGVIDKNQLKKVLKGCQKNQIEQILKDIDKNQDQKITKDEFISYIKKQNFMQKQDEAKS